MVADHVEVDVFLGIDVGKGEHHAVALDRAGTRLYDKVRDYRGRASQTYAPLPAFSDERGESRGVGRTLRVAGG
jgi:hypothetical protein